MRTLWLLFFATWTFAAVAEDKAPASLGELVKRAQEERVLENQALEAREREFREARSEQQARIEKLRAELAQERALGEDLKRRYTENDAYLSVQQEALREKTGSLGELFGVARQVAKDARSLLSTSLVSVDGAGAHLPEHEESRIAGKQLGHGAGAETRHRRTPAGRGPLEERSSGPRHRSDAGRSGALAGSGREPGPGLEQRRAEGARRDAIAARDEPLPRWREAALRQAAQNSRVRAQAQRWLELINRERNLAALQR